MTTRDLMVAEMADDMKRSDSDAFINKINAAIRHYQPKRFWFNESRTVTFSMVADTDTYSFTTIGTEFYQIDGVFVTIATGDVREMVRANYAALEAMADSDTTSGEPSVYAYINRGLRFWSPPDDTYSARVTGHIKIAAPASGGESDNVWMTEAYDLIMSRAKAELYAHRYEDPANASVMQQAEASALRRLLSATGDKVATGYLTPTEF